MADKPCGECDYFDAVVRGKKETVWGWCAKKSVYPHKEGPGQKFPAGVKRVDDPSKLAIPVLVKKQEIVESCPHHTPPKKKMSKVELIEAAQKKGSKVVLR